MRRLLIADGGRETLRGPRLGPRPGRRRPFVRRPQGPAGRLFSHPQTHATRFHPGETNTANVCAPQACVVISGPTHSLAASAWALLRCEQDEPTAFLSQLGPSACSLSLTSSPALAIPGNPQQQPAWQPLWHGAALAPSVKAADRTSMTPPTRSVVLPYTDTDTDGPAAPVMAHADAGP